jgi:16S rRNA processing protein RimM
VLSAHGIKGEVKCRLVTDFPKRRLRKGGRVFIAGQPYTVALARVQPMLAYVKFEEVPDRTAADKLRGLDVEVPRADAHPLPRGQFYWHEVIGLEVHNASTGEVVGKVDDILETGANDVYIVHGSRGEILIPAIKSVIKRIDPQAGRMLIEPLPGLLP